VDRRFEECGFSGLILQDLSYAFAYASGSIADLASSAFKSGFFYSASLGQ
jgi:hypothetical protein